MPDQTPLPIVLDQDGIGRHAPLACPYTCGYTLDATWAVSDPGTTPDPGDLSLCGGCGGLLEWHPTQGWQPLSEVVKAVLIHEQPDEWAALLALQAATRAFRGLEPVP